VYSVLIGLFCLPTTELDVSTKQQRLETLRQLREDAASTGSPLPPMDQPHFICMWKSFYDIFIQQKNEQDAYHSIVSVGTLLIKLGDVGNRTGGKGQPRGGSPTQSSVDGPTESHSESQTGNKRNFKVILRIFQFQGIF